MSTFSDLFVDGKFSCKGWDLELADDGTVSFAAVPGDVAGMKSTERKIVVEFGTGSVDVVCFLNGYGRSYAPLYTEANDPTVRSLLDKCALLHTETPKKAKTAICNVLAGALNIKPETTVVRIGEKIAVEHANYVEPCLSLLNGVQLDASLEGFAPLTKDDIYQGLDSERVKRFAAFLARSVSRAVVDRNRKKARDDLGKAIAAIQDPSNDAAGKNAALKKVFAGDYLRRIPAALAGAGVRLHPSVYELVCSLGDVRVLQVLSGVLMNFNDDLAAERYTVDAADGGRGDDALALLVALCLLRAMSRHLHRFDPIANLYFADATARVCRGLAAKCGGEPDYAKDFDLTARLIKTEILDNVDPFTKKIFDGFCGPILDLENGVSEAYAKAVKKASDDDDYMPLAGFLGLVA